MKIIFALLLLATVALCQQNIKAKLAKAGVDVEALETKIQKFFDDRVQQGKMKAFLEGIAPADVNVDELQAKLKEAGTANEGKLAKVKAVLAHYGIDFEKVAKKVEEHLTPEQKAKLAKIIEIIREK